jgi:uncharacterized protein YoxC
MNNLENEKFQDLVLNHLAKLTQEITEVKLDVKDLKESQQQLQSKVDTIQTQTAQLTEDLSVLSAKMNHGFSDVVEVQKSLLEMYDDHEAAIRILRRMPV